MTERESLIEEMYRDERITEEEYEILLIKDADDSFLFDESRMNAT